MTPRTELHSSLHLHKMLLDTARTVKQAAREHPTVEPLHYTADEPHPAHNYHSESRKG